MSDWATVVAGFAGTAIGASAGIVSTRVGVLERSLVRRGETVDRAIDAVTEYCDALITSATGGSPIAVELIFRVNANIASLAQFKPPEGMVDSLIDQVSSINASSAAPNDIARTGATVIGSLARWQADSPRQAKARWKKKLSR